MKPDNVHEFVSSHFKIDELSINKVISIITYVRTFYEKYGHMPEKWQMPGGIYELCTLPTCPIAARKKTHPLLTDIIKRKPPTKYITEDVC